MDKILSQEEIDALLRGMEEGEVNATSDQEVASGVIRYDFANQDRIIRGRMPTLEIINDHFCKLIRNALSLGLRKIVDVGARGVEMMKFGEFIRTLPVPSSFHIFKMAPLRGNAILVLDSKLIFTLVDLFLGGSGKTAFRIEGRDFTAIESKLIRKVVNMIFADLEKAWNMVHPVAIQHVRSEINPQFVAIVSPSDVVIVTSFGVEIEQFTGKIIFCTPYSTIEPIKGILYSGYQSDHLEIDRSWIERFLERIKFAAVEVSVELGRGQITVQDLLHLKRGDVLPLEKEVSEPLVAKVEGIPKFLGRPGLYGGNKAFQVEEKIKLS